MSRSLLLAFASLVLVSSCGVPGSLSRPAPMWNKQEAMAADARRRANLCAQHHLTNSQRRQCTQQASTATSTGTTITQTTIEPPSPNNPPGSATSQTPQ